jgi:hypothetical protein
MCGIASTIFVVLCDLDRFIGSMPRWRTELAVCSPEVS